MSINGTCDVFVLRQANGLKGLSGEQVPVVRYLKPEEPYLQLWWLDVDTFESLMQNSKAVVNKLEVCRGHELRVAFEEAKKYGGGVANKLEGYPRSEFHVAKDDCAPRDLPLVMSLWLPMKLFTSALYGLEANEDEDDEYNVDKDGEDDEDKDDEYGWIAKFEILDQEMRKEYHPNMDDMSSDIRGYCLYF